MLVILVVMFAFAPLRVDAQTLTPQDARATLTVARAQATAASDLATANAPTSTPPATSTPQSTATSTVTPQPTTTSTSTITPAPSATPTMQASATSQPTVTTISTPTPTAPARKASTIYDDWPLVVLILGGALAIIIALYRLLIGHETILPGRGNRSDDGRFH